MRKFKHKLSGDVVESIEKHNMYMCGTKYSIPTYIVENSTDWEEIKSEYPKIISFRTKDKHKHIVNLDIQGNFGLYTLDEMLYGDDISVKTTDVEIYKVKTSETEIFTVGDKVIHPFNKQIKEIDKFIICNDITKDVVACFDIDENRGKIFACVCNNAGNVEVTKLEKAPNPLFVTEDGVEIFKGDTYYYVAENEWKVFIDKANNIFKAHLSFSTEPSANKYIEDNKPRFSKKDIEEALSKSVNAWIYDKNVRIIDCFKQKLGI